MSNWTVGKLNFPVAPEVVTYTNEPALLKTKSLFMEAPWVFNIGPNNETIQLDGQIFDPGARASTIYTNYISVLDDYNNRHGAIPMLLFFNGTGSWQTNGGVSTFKPTGDKYVKYKFSTYIDFGAANRQVYYNLPTAMDFSNYNIISLWLYGISTEKFKLAFYNEQFASRRRGFKVYPQSSGAQWYQRIFTTSSIDGSNTVLPTGSPVRSGSGWNKIRSVVFEPSTTYAGAVRVDMMVIGTGWQYSDPNSKKKGIAMISRFENRLEAGDIRGYRYRLQLTDTSEYYGVRKWAKS